MRGSAPRWAKASRDAGRQAQATPLSVSVYLPLRDSAGAEALLKQVSDPTSASYGQFLSTDQVKAAYAPADADVQAVRDFLTGAGFKVTDVAENNVSVEASGTVEQANAAFGADIHKFNYRGKTLYAPTADVSVPAAIAGKVVAVGGLDQSGALIHPLKKDGGEPQLTAKPNAKVTAPAKHAGDAPAPDAFVNAPPCSTYFGEKTATTLPKVNGQAVPYAPCGYTPDQYQGAYGTADAIKGGLDGSGVTVAITDAYAAPTILQDANKYASKHNQAPFKANQFAQIFPKKGYRYGYDDQTNGDLCGEQGWYGEETLDVEAVHAMAPGANVLYVAGRSCDDPDLLGAINKIVAKHRADIITNSWGSTGEDTPADLQAQYHTTFLLAGLEGISINFSSGDDGDDSLDTDDGSPAADFPATEPLVTAVGGTALGVNEKNKYGFELGWATGSSNLSADGKSWTPPFPGDFLYGGGGGTSSLFAQPDYQAGHVPPAIANGMRTIPDVAMDGDPQTGMLVGETQTFHTQNDKEKYSEFRIGGTSLASPLFAGMEALALQARGAEIGFANPRLYKLDQTSAVRDIKPAPTRAVVRVNNNNGENGDDGTTPILRSLGDEGQSLHLRKGWDNLTGIGTPNGVNFLATFLRK